jgi:hypothetical protein
MMGFTFPPRSFKKRPRNFIDVNVHDVIIDGNMKPMAKAGPTLRIDIHKRGNPQCSVCGEEFGREGLTRGLLDAFALHVRRRHLPQELNYGVSDDSRVGPSRNTREASAHS